VDGLPDPRTLPPDVTAEFTERGGHGGFLEGRWPWRLESWAERRAVEFLARVLTDRREREASR
jgi:predicted alpha/beta-fold hydrolase